MDSSEDKLVLQFIPSLVALLKAAENRKGSPLEESEVIEIRDTSTCIRVPITVFIEVENSQGYSDIDPEDCWNQWCEARKYL